MYKIGFVPLDSFGHVNACLGLAKNLSERGHNCVFITNKNWKDMITKYGFEYQIYIEEQKPNNGDEWHSAFIDQGHTLKLSSFEQIRQFNAITFPKIINDIKGFNDNIKEILNDIKCDAIVVDSFICIPAVVCAGVPWINLGSCNQLTYFNDERLPPGFSGYATNSDKQLWKEFRDEVIDAFSQEWNSFNSWLESMGAPPLEDETKFFNPSPWLNLYLCPQELSYEDIAPQDSKHFAIDELIRTENESNDFELPENLCTDQGSLIYISMGTLASSDLSLMQRLVSILSKSENRFIISKGLLGDQLELAHNMWGQNSVPQLKVLPLVDVVLTHGGNNTVTESLYFGKPMIVLPVFGDQFDNAQRVEEKGLGIRLDPYYCEEEDLLNAIEAVVNDTDLKERYQQISERMKNSESREKASQLIEDIIENWKSEENNN